jgi:hypothetical protein
MKKFRNLSCCHHLLFVLYSLALAFIFSATILVCTSFTCHTRSQFLIWVKISGYGINTQLQCTSIVYICIVFYFGHKLVMYVTADKFKPESC